MIVGEMLVGRDSERARLGQALEAARRGRGGAIVVRGAPGVGKTALVRELRDRADGFRILTARGVESESGLAFAGLSDLLHPVIDHIDALPEAKRTALRAALALGPPACPTVSPPTPPPSGCSAPSPVTAPS